MSPQSTDHILRIAQALESIDRWLLPFFVMGCLFVVTNMFKRQ